MVESLCNSELLSFCHLPGDGIPIRAALKRGQSCWWGGDRGAGGEGAQTELCRVLVLTPDKTWFTSVDSISQMEPRHCQRLPVGLAG